MTVSKDQRKSKQINVKLKRGRAVYIDSRLRASHRPSASNVVDISQLAFYLQVNSADICCEDNIYCHSYQYIL